MNRDCCDLYGLPNLQGLYGYDGVKSAFETGKGRVVIRAKASIEINDNEKDQIIVSEIPYMVNKSDYIDINIYNIEGKLVENIFNGYQTAGYYSIVWDSKDFSSGVYIVKLNIGSNIYSNNITLLK